MFQGEFPGSFVSGRYLQDVMDDNYRALFSRRYFSGVLFVAKNGRCVRVSWVLTKVTWFFVEFIFEMGTRM